MTDCSVVMATYNGARYLPAQLESIAAQEQLPAELIVSDDGSLDGTLAVVVDFQQRAPFDVKLIRGPGRGYAENFWSAATHASCDIIAWSDQDDVWHPRKLATSLRALDDAQVAMVSHSAVLVGPSLEAYGGMYPGYSADRVLEPLQGAPLAVPPGFASTFRRCLLDKVSWSSRPFSHQLGSPLGHDHAIDLVAFAGYRRAEIAAVLAQHRQHASNVAGDPTEGKLRQVLTGLTMPASRYHGLSDYVNGYARWLEECGFAEARIYYDVLAGRADLRSQVRSAATVRARLHQWVTASRSDVYGPLEERGFGRMALVNDLASAILGTAHERG